MGRTDRSHEMQVEAFQIITWFALRSPSPSWNMVLFGNQEEFCFCQAANGASSALSIFEKLSKFAG